MENNFSDHAIAQTAVTLSILREDALDALIKDGKSSSFKSEGKRTGEGLKVDTVNEGDNSKSSLTINGEEKESTGWTGVFLDGKYQIKREENGQTSQEVGEFHLKNSHFDDFRGLNHFTVSLGRQTADGKPIEAYKPAVTDIKTDHGQIVYDNGQAVRLAKTTDGANCKPDYSSPNSRKMDCEYVLEDAELGTLSFNETREKNPAGFYHRSVVRDMNGQVLGIVSQNYKLDENGDITTATTSARKPMKSN